MLILFLNIRKKNTKKKESSTTIQSFTLAGENLEYVFIRDNHQTLRLRVKADSSIEVKAPHKCRQVDVDAFLQKKSMWIQEKRSDMLTKGLRPHIDFSHDSAFFCLGKKILFHYPSSFTKKRGETSECDTNNASNTNNTNNDSNTENARNTSCASGILNTSNIPNTPNTFGGHDGGMVNVESFAERTSPFSSRFLLEPGMTQSFESIANSISKDFKLSIKAQNASLVPILLIQAKTDKDKNYTNSIQIWRKKSAELFLKVCLDTVWEALCTDDFIPQELREFFQKTKKPSLRVRVLSRRFGSCSTKQEICLARHLVSFPLELIEYVIVHECCHLVHMDHSKAFYEIMESCCQNAKKKREYLWDWSGQHSQF